MRILSDIGQPKIATTRNCLDIRDAISPVAQIRAVSAGRAPGWRTLRRAARMEPVPSILTIVGARPQFIKAAPVSSALAARGIREAIVHTGQHFDATMSDVFFAELEIAAPAYNLEVDSLGHGAMTGRMIENSNR